ncbi:dynamin family protein [Neobacillus sp.]|uniref:dynamin family protein n=1 Tax=Neobacillus sp. TaxID=2675273 RepID=UPI0028A29823|nr:dynamin family protein [Neobacillus sp.]
MDRIGKVIDQLSSLKSLQMDLECSESEKDILSFKLDILTRALDRSKNNEFTIHVIGTMKSGKSTFINALLGRDLLPNESAACTLVPVTIKKGRFNQKIEKVLTNGESAFLSGKKIENAFLRDTRNYRAKLENGQVVDISKYRLSYPFTCLPETADRVELSIVDTPGPNEMKQFADTINLEQSFSECLKDSSLIFFVIDIQYYKDEENKKLLDSILSYRPDLKDHVIFILNKMDRLMEQKNVTVEGTVTEIKETLANWGFDRNLVFPVSSKKALLSRLTENKMHEKITFLQRLASLFRKEKSILDTYQQDFNEVLPLIEKKVEGKVFAYKPEPEEYYQELFQQSNLRRVEDYLKNTVFQHIEEYMKMLNYDLASDSQKWILSTVGEQVGLLDEKIVAVPIDKQMAKLKSVKKAIQTIHSFYDGKTKVQLLKGISKREIEKKVMDANNLYNRFSSSCMPSYSTSWVEYRDDSGWVDSATTEPGYQKKQLEEYYSRVLHEAADVACNCVRKLVREKKEVLKKNIGDFTDDLEKKLTQFYKQNGRSFKLPISRSTSFLVDDNYPYYIMSAPNLYIESKHRSKERMIFKGRGEISYVSYRLQNVSDFKDSGRRDVEGMFEGAADFILTSFYKAVEEQILPSYKQQLKQVVEMFEERLKEVEIEYQGLEEEYSYLLTVKERLVDISFTPSTSHREQELVPGVL